MRDTPIMIQLAQSIFVYSVAMNLSFRILPLRTTTAVDSVVICVLRAMADLMASNSAVVSSPMTHLRETPGPAAPHGAPRQAQRLPLLQPTIVHGPALHSTEAAAGVPPAWPNVGIRRLMQRCSTATRRGHR